LYPFAVHCRGGINAPCDLLRSPVPDCVTALCWGDSQKPTSFWLRSRTCFSQHQRRDGRIEGRIHSSSFRRLSGCLACCRLAKRGFGMLTDDHGGCRHGLKEWHSILSLVDHCSALSKTAALESRPIPGGSVRYRMPLSRCSEPVVQPTVAYGRCVTGNGGVLSVPTMYSGLTPAGFCREARSWNVSAVGTGEARLCGKVNVSEALINLVSENGPKLRNTVLAERHTVGSSTWSFDDADITTDGGQTPPNPHLWSTGNWVSPYRCRVRGRVQTLLKERGRRTARGAVAGAGRGGRKKRMAACNGRHRDFNVISRETGQTCDWSFLCGFR